jgi:hypothetical protein
MTQAQREAFATWMAELRTNTSGPNFT